MLSIVHFHRAAQKFLNVLPNYQDRCVQELFLLCCPTTTLTRLNKNQIVGSSPALFQEVAPSAFDPKEYQDHIF